jgi:hypothetical protein
LPPDIQGWRDASSLGSIDRGVVTQFYWYNVINQFLGAVIGGAGFQQMGALLDQPSE